MRRLLLSTRELAYALAAASQRFKRSSSPDSWLSFESASRIAALGSLASTFSAFANWVASPLTSLNSTLTRSFFLRVSLLKVCCHGIKTMHAAASVAKSINHARFLRRAFSAGGNRVTRNARKPLTIPNIAIATARKSSVLKESPRLLTKPKCTFRDFQHILLGKTLSWLVGVQAPRARTDDRVA